MSAKVPASMDNSFGAFSMELSEGKCGVERDWVERKVGRVSSWY